MPYYIGDLKRDPNLENYPLGENERVLWPLGGLRFRD